MASSKGAFALTQRQEFVQRHGGDGSQVLRLVGDLGDVREQVLVVCAERKLVGIPSRYLRVYISFSPAASAFVGDDDRLLHELVFCNDGLNDPCKIVGAAAGARRDDEFHWLCRLPIGLGSTAPSKTVTAVASNQDVLLSIVFLPC